ncbi:MAG: insulinase family protein, partial [Acidobacteria bacterium]|nr:insulinase family protein [Acidobacteriota bacterium]
MKFVIKPSIDRSKVVLMTVLILVFSVSSFAQTARSGIAAQAALVSEFEVNGLKVLVKRRASAPTVAAGLFIRGGARNITEANAGIESFMLNAAAEASTKYPREVVRRELAGTGSSIGAGSNNDFSVFSLASTRQNFDRSWDIFTDLIINPTFEKVDVDRVRDGIVTGLRERESDADNYLQILQDRIIYADHPYANDVNGTIDTLSALTPKDLRDYHKKVMESSRLLLVVVGDVDAEDLKKRVA